jgi:predicted  nucleic acid-binding Zn-ribbon protein
MRADYKIEFSRACTKLVSLEAKIEKLKREKRQLKAELRKWEQ